MVHCKLQDVGLFQFALSNLCKENSLLLECTHDLQAHFVFQDVLVLSVRSYRRCALTLVLQQFSRRDFNWSKHLFIRALLFFSMTGFETCDREDTSIICSISPPPYNQLLPTTRTFFPATGLESSTQSAVATIMSLASVKLSSVYVQKQECEADPGRGFIQPTDTHLTSQCKHSRLSLALK